MSLAPVRALYRALGESGISFFAVHKQAEVIEADFPTNLDGVRMPMPGSGSILRRSLEAWFERYRVQPLVVAEFEDRALMKAFGERGSGVFTSPTAVEQDVLDKYGVVVIGRTQEIAERFYVISAERRIKNPAVSAITKAARSELLA